MFRYNHVIKNNKRIPTRFCRLLSEYLLRCFYLYSVLINFYEISVSIKEHIFYLCFDFQPVCENKDISKLPLAQHFYSFC